MSKGRNNNYYEGFRTPFLPDFLDVRQMKLLNVPGYRDMIEMKHLDDETTYAKGVDYCINESNARKQFTILIADSKEIGLKAVERLACEDYADRREAEGLPRGGYSKDPVNGDETYYEDNLPILDISVERDEEYEKYYSDTVEIFLRICNKPGQPLGVMIDGSCDFANRFEEGLVGIGKNAGKLYIVLIKYNLESTWEFNRGVEHLRKALNAGVYDLTIKESERIKIYTDFYEAYVGLNNMYNLSSRGENERIIRYVLKKERHYAGLLICKLLSIIGRTKVRNTTITLSDFRNVFAQYPHCKPDVSDYYSIADKRKTESVNNDSDTFSKISANASKNAIDSQTRTAGEEDCQNTCEKKDEKIVKKLFKESKPIVKPNIEQEMSSFEGLRDIKKKIKSIVDMFEYQELRREKGEADVEYSNVFLFVGPPGTAKTSVAKKLADVLYRSGYLENDNVACVTGAQLKGKYVGHSAPKVADMFERNGVIFIDEAYSVISGDGERDSFANEAIAELLVQIENHANDRVVILAGYGGDKSSEKDNKMKDFLDMNPGIASRINRTICFKAYSAEESLAITKKIVGNKGMILEDDCDNELTDYFKKRASQEDFGNGRECRSLVENSIVSLASRIADSEKSDITGTELNTITRMDIRNAIDELMAATKAQKGWTDSKPLGFLA